MDWTSQWNSAFVEKQQAAHSAKAGQFGGLVSQQISDYHFHTENPDERSVPLSIESIQQGWRHPSHDTVTDHVHSWGHELTSDGYKRGVQKLVQMQSTTPKIRARGIATTFTRELAHPHDPSEETYLLNYSYMPAHATERQVRAATQLATKLGSFVDYHRQGEEYFWNAPGQAFRHEARK